MSVHQELNRTGSTEEQSDDTGGRRTTKQQLGQGHIVMLVAVPLLPPDVLRAKENYPPYFLRCLAPQQT